MRKLLTLSALIVVVDQVSKFLVKGGDLFGLHVAGMAMYGSHDLIGQTVRLTYIENPGMAFGWNFDMPVVLSLFSIAASIFLIHLLRKTESAGITGLRIAFALILGGAMGNLIDRAFYGILYDYAGLFHGRVVDFIDIDIPDIRLFGHEWTRFYIFNIADASVSIGVILLLIFYPTKKKKGEPTADDAGTPTAAALPGADAPHAEPTAISAPTGHGDSSEQAEPLSLSPHISSPHPTAPTAPNILPPHSEGLTAPALPVDAAAQGHEPDRAAPPANEQPATP